MGGKFDFEIVNFYQYLFIVLINAHILGPFILDKKIRKKNNWVNDRI